MNNNYSDEETQEVELSMGALNQIQTEDAHLVETFGSIEPPIGGSIDKSIYEDWIYPAYSHNAILKAMYGTNTKKMDSSEEDAELFRTFGGDLMAAAKGTLGESDPLGLDQHSPGAKLDSGKNRLALVLEAFAPALWQVGEVGTFGANKYSDNGWLEVENGIERYKDAMYRHLNKAAQGEVNDPDSELSHWAHAAWNALAVLTLSSKLKNEA